MHANAWKCRLLLMLLFCDCYPISYNVNISLFVDFIYDFFKSLSIIRLIGNKRKYLKADI